MKAFNLIMLVIMTCLGFTLQGQNYSPTDLKVRAFLETNDLESCFGAKEKALQEARSNGDSALVGELLISYNPCTFAKKKYKEYIKTADHALSLLDSTNQSKSYFDALRHKLNYVSFFDRENVLPAQKRIVDFSKAFMSDSVYFSTQRGYINSLSRNKDYDLMEKEAYSLLNQSDNNHNFVVAHNVLANALSDADPQRSDSLFRIGIARDKTGVPERSISAIYRDYGNYLSAKGRNVEAITYLIQAIEYIPEGRDFQLSKIMILNTIAQLFSGMDQNKRALEYSANAIAIGEENGFSTQKGMITIVNAQIHLQLGNIQKAQEQYKQAIEHLKQKKEPEFLLNALSLLGESHIDLNENNAAEKIKNEINTLNSEFDFDFDNRYYLGFAAKLYDTDKDWANASKTYEKILLNSYDNKRPKQELYALKGLMNSETQLGNFEAAHSYNTKYHEIYDSIYRSNRNQEINILESEFKRNEQNAEIALLDKENEIQILKLKQQERLLIFSLIGLLGLALFSFFLYKLFTKVNQQNKIIEKALDDKDLLLKEIHHRVKNNLQMVSSLLTLQSREIEDAKAVQAINEGKARVRSMALIHQNLYTQDNLTGINAKEYLEKLTNELFDTYNIDHDRIKLTLDIEDLDIDVDTIVPLGLIINELVTNSLKHAFPNNKNGKLLIELKDSKEGLVLNVEDNGIGTNKVFTNSDSFGNKLIATLTSQLEGKMSVIPDKGMQTKIIFKAYKMAS